MKSPYRALVLPLLLASIFGAVSCGWAIDPKKLIDPPDLRKTPLPAEESAQQFTTPDNLKIQLLLAEPQVLKPVFMNFDERGRLWIAQFRQYPQPAGLTALSHDSYWRAVWDKVPPPPPNQIPGADQITIHEDTKGNGTFDKQTTFISGLNIATSFVRGRGGVWVLNPPYLLFYPLKENEDTPSGPPEVRLAGFGLEDTHSVCNSLCWGPDGWLYAAQGSTVTGNVIRPGLDQKPVHSLGQLIWRYHPEKRIYEIFAEGGGNAFGCEFDAVGRVYSGYNGGDARGFCYVQGGYYQKTFGKHGELSNPFAFGYFPAMKHHKAPRFTHTFCIYDADNFAPEYRGKLFGVAPLLHHVVLSDVQPNGSTIQTKDIGFPVTTADRWFTPVDVKLGPDGSLYIADWYDFQCAHFRSQDGKINKELGRVYRLAAADAKPLAPFNLAAKSTPELVQLLNHPNRWFRQTALRLLGDRKDQAALSELRQLLAENKGQVALEALWAINLCGGFDEALASQALGHENPHVRRWTVRLLGDPRQVSSPLAERLANLARTETDVEVRSQLASTAKRLPAKDDLAIVRQLLAHSEDVDDPHVPLLVWWALEAPSAGSLELVLGLFEDPEVWRLPLVQKYLLDRLMRRFASSGQQKDLRICARLLKMSPNEASTKILMTGFEAAFAGRSLPPLPDELAAALESYSKTSIVFGLRQGRKPAIDEALQTLADPKGDRAKQLQYVQILGEVPTPTAMPVLLDCFARTSDAGLRAATLTALQRYDDPKIGAAVVAAYGNLTDDLRSSAQSLLVSRKAWTLGWLEAVDAQQVDVATIPPEVASQLLRHRDERIATLVRKYWGELKRPTSDQLQREIDRVAAVVSNGQGSPVAGRPLFENQCGKCHTLFAKGGHVGPDLTAYQRTNLDHMLISIINPSAEIREGFATYQLSTKDGRAMIGLIVDQDLQTIVLRGVDGQDIVVPRDNIDEMEASKLSLMPEGLLKIYTDQQLRDLFAFLRMTQPLIDK